MWRDEVTRARLWRHRHASCILRRLYAEYLQSHKAWHASVGVGVRHSWRGGSKICCHQLERSLSIEHALAAGFTYHESLTNYVEGNSARTGVRSFSASVTAKTSVYPKQTTENLAATNTTKSIAVAPYRTRHAKRHVSKTARPADFVPVSGAVREGQRVCNSHGTPRNTTFFHRLDNGRRLAVCGTFLKNNQHPRYPPHN